MGVSEVKQKYKVLTTLTGWYVYNNVSLCLGNLKALNMWILLLLSPSSLLGAGKIIKIIFGASLDYTFILCLSLDYIVFF